jgi:hypothetical protein
VNSAPISTTTRPLLLYSEPASDKRLRQCAERRHFTRLQLLAGSGPVIVGENLSQWERKKGSAVSENSILERVTAAAEERQLSHNSLIAYRRTWLKIIWAAAEGLGLETFPVERLGV